MNIETLNNNNSKAIDFEQDINSLNRNRSFSYNLELPEEKSFAELMQSEGNEENKSISQPVAPKPQEQPNPELIKKANDLAIADKKPLKKNESIKNIKQVIFNNNLPDRSKKIKINFDSLNDNDIKFLKHCIDNPNMVVQNLQPQNLQPNFAIADASGAGSYKSVDFSKSLSNLIEYAYKTQKPVRLDFDNNSSVILKIDKQGKLSAEFMSSNAAMENLLKNNIPHLRNRLDSEGIEYNEVLYKGKDKNKKQDNEESNKEE